MIMHHACNGMLSVTMIRAALAACVGEYRMLPAKAVSHPAQAAALVDIAIFMCDSTGFYPDDVGGIPFSQDIRMPIDCMEFRDADDKVIARIEHLAVPVGFEVFRHEA